MRNLFTWTLVLGLFVAGIASAEDAKAPPPPPDVPPPPPLIEDRPSDEPIGEPEVRIVPREDAMVEEYRINGQLYMIHVKPKNGPSYYLLDTDGDGELETRSSELDPKIMVPGWTIFRW